MKFASLAVLAALALGAAGAPASAYDFHHARMRRQHHFMSSHARHAKTYYGVGFGGQHRTTATGGNPGGYSSRN